MAVQRIVVHPTASVHPTALLEGDVAIGAYTTVGAGSILTGRVSVGHHVNIEGGRPRAPIGTSTAREDEEAIIGAYCWENHGAIMHGTRLADEAAVGGNTFCDYGTRLGRGAILGNGSATNVDQVIPDNALAQGVPESAGKWAEEKETRSRRQYRKSPEHDRLVVRPGAFGRLRGARRASRSEECRWTDRETAAPGRPVPRRATLVPSRRSSL